MMTAAKELRQQHKNHNIFQLVKRNVMKCNITL